MWRLKRFSASTMRRARRCDVGNPMTTDAPLDVVEMIRPTLSVMADMAGTYRIMLDDAEFIRVAYVYPWTDNLHQRQTVERIVAMLGYDMPKVQCIAGFF